MKNFKWWQWALIVIGAVIIGDWLITGKNPIEEMRNGAAAGWDAGGKR